MKYGRLVLNSKFPRCYAYRKKISKNPHYRVAFFQIPAILGINLAWPYCWNWSTTFLSSQYILRWAPRRIFLSISPWLQGVWRFSPVRVMKLHCQKVCFNAILMVWELCDFRFSLKSCTNVKSNYFSRIGIRYQNSLKKIASKNHTGKLSPSR